ncbi:hypothetical protein WL30_11365 [Burkholderia ubonensis]|nr:hypothetical protein WL30_11365 [Burkholderia ubonensis]KWB15148.1 hypothetical protein WL31_14980 [Burkholderia ubonensis]
MEQLDRMSPLLLRFDQLDQQLAVQSSKTRSIGLDLIPCYYFIERPKCTDTPIRKGDTLRQIDAEQADFRNGAFIDRIIRQFNVRYATHGSSFG